MIESSIKSLKNLTSLVGTKLKQLCEARVVHITGSEGFWYGDKIHDVLVVREIKFCTFQCRITEEESLESVAERLAQLVFRNRNMGTGYPAMAYQQLFLSDRVVYEQHHDFAWVSISVGNFIDFREWDFYGNAYPQEEDLQKLNKLLKE